MTCLVLFASGPVFLFVAAVVRDNTHVWTAGFVVPDGGGRCVLTFRLCCGDGSASDDRVTATSIFGK